MKKTLLYSLILAGLVGACTQPITREEPMVANETISLGFFPFGEETPDFTPYFEKRTLIFEDEVGLEYTFLMSQPIIQDAYSYLRTFPHPDRRGDFVDYRYAGNRAIFDFTSNALGARLSVVLEPDLCLDPQLNKDVVPEDFLLVRGIGFNDGDVKLTEPALAVEARYNRPCGQGQLLGDLTLGGRDFTNVSYQRQVLGDRYFEVYYSPEEGVVAIGTTYLFLVLKDSY